MFLEHGTNNTRYNVIKIFDDWNLAFWDACAWRPLNSRMWFGAIWLLEDNLYTCGIKMLEILKSFSTQFSQTMFEYYNFSLPEKVLNGSVQYKFLSYYAIYPSKFGENLKRPYFVFIFPDTGRDCFWIGFDDDYVYPSTINYFCKLTIICVLQSIKFCLYL